MKPSWLVVISFTLTFDLLVSVIPRSCVLDAKVLICKRLNFRLYKIYTIVTYDHVVDFLFLNNTRMFCSCRVIKLVQMLRLTDVITVTMRPCTLRHLKTCKVDPVVQDPELVAGLVVSREDSRRNWAIKHHVKTLWSKIKGLQHAELRSFFYHSLILDVQEELKRLKSPQTLFSKSYAAFMEGGFIAKPSGGGLTSPTTETVVQKMLHRWKSMAAVLDTSVNPLVSTVTTLPTTISTNSFDELAWRIRRYMAFVNSAKRRARMRPRRRGKRDDAVVIRRILSKIGLNKSDETKDEKLIPAIHDSMGAYSNNSRPLIAETLIRRKRHTGFASVVPYRAYAAGEFYSLYDTGGIWLALGKTPLLKTHSAPRRKYGRAWPVALGDPRFKSPVLFDTTTGKGPQLSPAEISGMSNEADRRIRSFIIFFVCLTGVITVIAVLLVMAIKGKRDSQGRLECQQMNHKCRCCRGFLLEPRRNLSDPNDPMRGLCLSCKSQVQTGTQTENTCHLTLDSKETVAKSLPGCQQTDRNVNQQTENSRATSGKSVVQEKDDLRAEYTFDGIGFESQQQYQPCLHGDLLTSRFRAAISRADIANTVNVVRSSSSPDLLNLETQVSIDSNTENNSNIDNIIKENICNTINIIDTTDHVDTNNNNNNVLYMAVNGKANVSNYYQTTRVSSSRHRNQAVSKLHRSSATFHCRSGYNLNDQVYHYVTKCRFYDPPQQCKLARNQNMCAADLTHHKIVDMTVNEHTISKLTSHDGDISQYLHDSKSSVNSHDCSSLHSSSSLLAVWDSDSDDADRQMEHNSTVSEWSPPISTTRMRSNSCRNNGPAKEELTTFDDSQLETKPNRSSLIGHSRRLDCLPLSTFQMHGSQQREFIKEKFTSLVGLKLGQSSRHDRSPSMSPAINSSSIEGVKNFLASSENTATMGSSEGTARGNEFATHKFGLGNRGNHHTIDTSEDGNNYTTGSRRSNEQRRNDVHQNTEDKNSERKKRKKTITIAGEQDINYSKGSKVGGRNPPVTVLEAPDDPELESGVPIGTTGDLIGVIDELENENKDSLPKEIELKRIGSAEIRERFLMKSGKKGKGKKQPERPPQETVANVAPPISIASDTNPESERLDPPIKKGDKKKKKDKKSKDDPQKTPSDVRPGSVASDKGQAQTASPKKKGDKKNKGAKKPKDVDGKKGRPGLDTKLTVNAKKKTREKDPTKEADWSAGMTAGLSQGEDHGEKLPPEKGDIKRQLVRDPDYEGPANLAGVISDDEFVIRRLQSRNEIPFNRYTSLSVILKAAEIDENAPLEDQLMVVRKSDINPMHMTTLQPLHHSIPYYISAAKMKKAVRIKKSKVVEDKLPTRKPPRTLGDAFRERDFLSGTSGLDAAPEFRFHGQAWSPRQYGVKWPVRYATLPPYSSPGYDCTGIKQPVGVIPVDPVPSQPKYGIVGTQRIQVPAWVSPLYKSYGIGGHMGLKSPFGEPLPFVQQQQQVNKPNVGFFQWLKNLIKRDTSKPRSRRRFPLYKLRHRRQKVKKTADLPLASLTDLLNAEKPEEKHVKTLEPAATAQKSVPGKEEIIEKPFDAQSQPDPNIPSGENEPSSISETSGENERSSISETSGEKERSSIVDASGEKERSSISETSGEEERSSIFDAPGEKERSSISDAPGEEEGSSIFDAPGEEERSSIFDAPGEEERSSIFDAPGEKERSSISDAPGEKERSSISDAPGETGRSSISEPPEETQRSSVSGRSNVPEELDDTEGSKVYSA